jgi:O-antigen/teichoic acid export membrane protein
MFIKSTSPVRQLAHRPFVRNIATVATGAAATQVVTFAFAPLITRLYGPEAYGLQGVFMSVVGLLATVAALSYPTAIVLPKRDADARGLAFLSISIGIGTSALAALAIAYLGTYLLARVNAAEIADFALLIPAAMLTSVFGATLGQWLVRERAFKLVAGLGVVTAALLGTIKVGLGLVNPTAGALIATNVVGAVVGTAIAYIAWRRARTRRPVASTGGPQASLWRLARRHADFPLLRTPQNLINSASQSLPVLLLATYFGAGASGQYSIAIAVLGVPATLIGGAVMTVFYPRINDAIADGEDARALIVRATVGMAATAALPFLGIVLLGPMLFSLVFGPAWEMAGTYAQWLAPWLFLQFLNKPAVAAIPPLRLQGGLLVYELFSTGAKVAALFVGWAMFDDPVVAVALFSASGVVAYALLISWVVRRSPGALDTRLEGAR